MKTFEMLTMHNSTAVENHAISLAIFEMIDGQTDFDAIKVLAAKGTAIREAEWKQMDGVKTPILTKLRKLVAKLNRRKIDYEFEKWVACIDAFQDAVNAWELPEKKV